MHASCMKPVKVDASLSHLIASLLKPFVSHAKNLSTLLLICLYVSRSSLYGLPCLCLRLFLMLTGMLAFIPLPLRYALASPVSYAESPATSPGLVLGLPLPYLTLIPSITSLKRLLSCSSPGPTTRLMGFLGHSYMDLCPLNPPVSIIAYKLHPLPAFTVVLSTATLSRLSFPVLWLSGLQGF